MVSQTDEIYLDAARERIGQNHGKSEKNIRFEIKSLGNGVATIFNQCKQHELKAIDLPSLKN